MSKTVVIGHHFDADANVYRLVFGTTFVEIIDEEEVEFISQVEEIVWDADDERWEGKDDLAIAAEQRVIVKELLTKRANDAAVAAEHASQARKDLGGIGEEL
jgi:hypothetical protein